jgi:hypothetical protein
MKGIRSLGLFANERPVLELDVSRPIELGGEARQGRDCQVPKEKSARVWRV